MWGMGGVNTKTGCPGDRGVARSRVQVIFQGGALFFAFPRGVSVLHQRTYARAARTILPHLFIWFVPRAGSHTRRDFAPAVHVRQIGSLAKGI